MGSLITNLYQQNISEITPKLSIDSQNIIVELKLQQNLYNYRDYDFYVLKDLDFDIISNCFDGKRILKSLYKTGWILKPIDIPLINIYDIEYGILNLIDSGELSVSILQKDLATHSLLDGNLEDAMYTKHIYSKYFVTYFLRNQFYENYNKDISNHIAQFYLFLLIK